jgi:hypothetical protein
MTIEVLTFTEAQRASPEVWAALRRTAAETGAVLMPEVLPSGAERTIAAWRARMNDPATPAVAADDHKSYLANLADIAAGRARVTEGSKR